MGNLSHVDKRISPVFRFIYTRALRGYYHIYKNPYVGGFVKLAEPVVARMGQRQVTSNVGNLKDLLEAQG